MIIRSVVQVIFCAILMLSNLSFSSCSNIDKHELSQDDQKQYCFNEFVKKSPFDRANLIDTLVANQQFDILKTAFQKKIIYPEDCTESLLKHKHFQVLCEFVYDGTWSRIPYNLIKNFMKYDCWNMIYKLLQDNKISKIDIVRTAIIDGYPAYVEKILIMGLSDQEVDEIARSLPFSLELFQDRIEVPNCEALSIFTQKFQNHACINELFVQVYDNTFCGHLLRSIKPNFVQTELVRCKKLLTQDITLSQDQKSEILSLYGHIIFEEDYVQTPCKLPIDHMRKLQDLHLNIWQMMQYFPNCLFDTKSLLSSEQSTLTHFMLINYLNKAKHRDRIFKWDGTPEDILYKNGIFDTLLKLESDMALQGYTTFVHGRSWYHNLVDDLRNVIDAVQIGKDELPIKSVMPYQWNLKKQTVSDLYAQRKKIVQNGSESEGDGVCLNSSILSNNDEPGSYAPLYSAAYFARNPKSSFENIFCESNMLKIYSDEDFFNDLCLMHQKYPDLMDVLYQSHKNSSSAGELIVVSMKNELVSDLTYIAGWQAKKQSQDSAMMHYSEQLMQAYQVMYNRIEGDYFYFAMPDIAGERKRGDYIVQSIHAADSKKYAKYCAKLQELFDVMRKDRDGQKNKG